MRKIGSKLIRLLTVIAAVCSLAFLTQAKAENYKVLHAFAKLREGWYANGLLHTASGNLYGTAPLGGNMSGNCYSSIPPGGCGTVFELSATGKFSVLHTFSFSDGAFPAAKLIQDSRGNLYGATIGGGTGCSGGCGVIFKITPTGKFTLLHSFTGGSDGANPNSELFMDAAGNLYGTAGNSSGTGEIFELTTSGKLEVLYSFNGTDGDFPNGVIRDSKGNLYGTTAQGGDLSCSNGAGLGCGVAYKLNTNGTETILYTFEGESDGLYPGGPLIMDKAGKLYGTAQRGGDITGCPADNQPPGCGTLFEINTEGTFSVLLKFDSKDGSWPNSSPQLTQDAYGFYGTTFFGGNGGCPGVGKGGCGVVFKVTPKGVGSAFYNFKEKSDGGFPVAGVVEDSKGNFYGTTTSGGDFSCNPKYGYGTGGCGVIFELTP